MATIVRQNRQIAQRLGNDALYGSGFDGNVTIAGITYLTRDMHYDNLTISSGGVLVTNGFRVYVRNTLTMNGGTVGAPAGYVSGTGTLVGRVSDEAGLKQYVVGASASGTQVPDDLLKDIEYVSNGWTIDPVYGFRRIQGADDGVDGTPVAGSPAPTLGTPGGPGAGGAGGLGTYSPQNQPSSIPGNPGGKGNPGNPGNVGGTGGTGSGGAGGDGGGLVVIMARSIVSTATSYVKSEGRAGLAGTTGALGNVGTAGTAGNKAPNIASTFAGNYVPAGHNPHVLVPGTANPVGWTAGNYVPAAHNPGNKYTVPGNVSHKADYNPGYYVHGHNSNYYHRTYNDYFGALQYHSTARENPGNTYYYYVAGNPTGNYHAYHNPSQQAHNPSHYAAAYTNPGHYNPSTTNPDTHAAGNPHAAYHNNEHNPAYSGGNAGVAGNAGAGGSGGTGNAGTSGGQGGLFVITDSTLPASLSLTAYKTVIIVNT